MGIDKEALLDLITKRIRIVAGPTFEDFYEWEPWENPMTPFFFRLDGDEPEEFNNPRCRK